MATGEQFIDEAIKSSRSVHNGMPDIDTAIVTRGDNSELQEFDHIIGKDQLRQKTVGKRTWLLDSTIKPGLSPFDRTLYLDSDTYVSTDIGELFDLLDNFDLAVASKPDKEPIPDLPDPWHEYNCGVIAYKDSVNTRSFLSEWNEIYENALEKQDQPEDQPAFAKALFRSTDLKWYTLPRKYNVRFPRRGTLAGEAKIIHGRHPQGLASIAEELNKSSDLRIFQEKSYLFNPAVDIKHSRSLRYSFEESLTEHGLLGTIKKLTLNKILN
jgi:lipopolysaccharide biosynthesis glycosyltransferase